MKQKLVQYFNEALAMENAAVDRNQTRMSETPIWNMQYICSSSVVLEKIEATPSPEEQNTPNIIIWQKSPRLKKFDVKKWLWTHNQG